jgi:hypothetical protein
LRAVAATLAADDLRWLAGYLAKQSAGEVQATLAQLASGAATVAALQAPPTPQPDTPQTGGMAFEPAPQPAGAVNPGPAAGQTPVYPNGVLVAAAMLLLLLLGFGVVLSLRGDSYENPG